MNHPEPHARPGGPADIRSGDPVSFDYIRDPDEISRRSFAAIEQTYDFSRLPGDIAAVARRLVHARGDPALLDHLAWSEGAAAAGATALKRGAALLCDSNMTAAGITRSRLPAANAVLCRLDDRRVAGRAAETGITRSAAAVEFWPPDLAGALAVIGNAPTALFRLLELLHEGAPKPALVIGLPVGFIGAAESKQALIGSAPVLGIPYLTLTGRDGGSPLATAAVNALARLANDLS